MEGKSKVMAKPLEFDNNYFGLQEPHNFLINQFLIEFTTYRSTYNNISYIILKNKKTTQFWLAKKEYIFYVWAQKCLTQVQICNIGANYKWVPSDRKRIETNESQLPGKSCFYTYVVDQLTWIWQTL